MVLALRISSSKIETVLSCGGMEQHSGQMRCGGGSRRSLQECCILDTQKNLRVLVKSLTSELQKLGPVLEQRGTNHVRWGWMYQEL